LVAGSIASSGAAKKAYGVEPDKGAALGADDNTSEAGAATAKLIWRGALTMASRRAA
jgi:hypothetical protein